MSSDGDQPPKGGGGKASSTIIGIPQQPATPGAPARPSQPPAPTKRSTLPPPNRTHLPSQPSQPLIPPTPIPGAPEPPTAPHAAHPAAAQPHAAEPHAAAAPPHPAQPQPASPHAAHAPHQPAAWPPTAPPPQEPPAPAASPGGADPMWAASGSSLPEARAMPGSQHDLPPGASFDFIEQPGSRFVAFLKISAKRAFRLRIEPSEVLPSERRTLEHAVPPIVDRNLQAFLAWRRSVLFLVASALIPLTVIGVIDALQSRKFTPIFFVRGAPAVAEGIFAWICWSQLKRWAEWRTQRRKLFWGWLLFMLTPFIVFVYPLRTIFDELGGARREALLALGVEGAYRQAVMPFVFAMLAMLQLAPKAISLMPGLIRASLVIKLLFPGSSAPGWLMVMSAPLYALLAYVILIIPYQFTGSGWFVAGILGVVAGQAVLARAGFALAKPLEEAEALRQIRRVRTYYVVVMIVSALLIVVALGSLVSQLNLRATDVITAVLKFETNVLILTMIGADLVVTNLDRARGYTAGRGHVEEQTEVKIAAFVSLEAPPTPPPPGPAQ